MPEKPAQPPAKNPAAQALARLRWRGTTAGERKQLMSRLVKLAWKKKPMSKRTNQGRPRDPDRCPCGAMTRTRAAQRKHVCARPNTDAGYDAAAKPKQFEKIS
jgi:hypothetical protein